MKNIVLASLLAAAGSLVASGWDGAAHSYGAPAAVVGDHLYLSAESNNWNTDVYLTESKLISDLEKTYIDLVRGVGHMQNVFVTQKMREIRALVDQLKQSISEAREFNIDQETVVTQALEECRDKISTMLSCLQEANEPAKRTSTLQRIFTLNKKKSASSEKAGTVEQAFQELRQAVDRAIGQIRYVTGDSGTDSPDDFQRAHRAEVMRQLAQEKLRKYLDAMRTSTPTFSDREDIDELHELGIELAQNEHLPLATRRMIEEQYVPRTQAELERRASLPMYVLPVEDARGRAHGVVFVRSGGSTEPIRPGTR